MGSFTQKLLRASLVLPQGNFSGGGNTLVLENFRMSARLTGTRNYTNFCDLRVWGMKQSDMNSVTVLWGQGGVYTDSLNIEAVLILESNDGSGWLQIFQGQFFDAQPDYQDLPNVNLHVTCQTAYAARVSADATQSSYPNDADVATVAQQLAGNMGFAFENNGVTGQLHTPHLSGTYFDQLEELRRSGGFDYYFTSHSGSQSTLAICPNNQPRQNQSTVVMSADTGLVGYVSLTRFGGVEFDCLFTPAIDLGAPVKIQDSPVPGTNGTWYPYHMEHTLDSWKPGGSWFSHLLCLPYPESSAAGAS